MSLVLKSHNTTSAGVFDYQHEVPRMQRSRFRCTRSKMLLYYSLIHGMIFVIIYSCLRLLDICVVSPPSFFVTAFIEWHRLNMNQSAFDLVRTQVHAPFISLVAQTSPSKLTVFFDTQLDLPDISAPLIDWLAMVSSRCITY